MEIVDIVDADDTLIGTAPKDEARQKGLLTRVSFIVLLNSRNELYLQQRKATKKTYPLYWSGSAAGHVRSGESFHQAALRELQEELGVTTELTEIGKFTSETDKEIVTVFVGRSEGPYTLEAASIERAEDFSPQRLQAEMPSMKTTSYLQIALPMVTQLL